jgi:N,N'-diacetyllegionaminate synthase
LDRLKIIFEVGSVHDGSLGNALRAIDFARESGATHVKFQAHIAEAESLYDAPSPSYFSGETRWEYFNRTGFSEAQWVKLARHSNEVGVGFVVSPFSIEAVDLLEAIGVEAYKIPSGEVTNIPMLEKISELGKPVFLSTGMSNWGEIDRAVSVFQNVEDLSVLQCTSCYPCPPEKVGLNIIPKMLSRYERSVGFSDHTMGYVAAVGAVLLGADTIEKHFTFSRLMYGSDAKHGMEPAEMASFCMAVKEAYLLKNRPVDKDDLKDLLNMKTVFEKSIVASRDLRKNSVVTLNDLAFKKPGDGISAAFYESVLNRKLKSDVSFNHKFIWSDFQ